MAYGNFFPSPANVTQSQASLSVTLLHMLFFCLSRKETSLEVLGTLIHGQKDTCKDDQPLS